MKRRTVFQRILALFRPGPIDRARKDLKEKLRGLKRACPNVPGVHLPDGSYLQFRHFRFYPFGRGLCHSALKQPLHVVQLLENWSLIETKAHDHEKEFLSRVEDYDYDIQLRIKNLGF